MSVPATAWAWKVYPGSAPLKLMLLSLADRADEYHRCYPSIERLVNDTGLNRKTVQAGLVKLEGQGFITDTGKRKGPTRRVKVWQLDLSVTGKPAKKAKIKNDPENGTIKNEEKAAPNDPENGNDPKNGNIPENGTLNDPENGTLNDPKNGTQNLTGNLTRNLCTSPAAANDQNTTQKSKVPYETIRELYQEFLVEQDESLIGCQELTEKRKRTISKFWTRMKSHPAVKEGKRTALESVQMYFTAIHDNRHLFRFMYDGSQTHPNWKADIEYICRPDTLVKVRETISEDQKRAD